MKRFSFHTAWFGFYSDVGSPDYHGNAGWYIKLRVGLGAGYATWFGGRNGRRWSLPWFTFYLARNCAGGPRRYNNTLKPWQFGVTRNGNHLPMVRS